MVFRFLILACWLLALLGSGAPARGSSSPDAARDDAARDDAAREGAAREGEAERAVARDLGLTETVEVTGRLGTQPAGAASPSPVLVDGHAMRQGAARSVPEALAQDVAVHAIDQVGNGRQLSLSLRGFAASEGATALLVDGVRVSDPDTNAVAWEMLRLEDIESVAITAEPRGASVGGGSLAGVVSVTRRQPAATPSAGAAARAGAFGWRDLSGWASGPAGSWRLLATGGAFEDSGFRDDAGSRERAARVAAARDFGGTALTLSLGHVGGRWRHPGALTAQELADDATQAPFNALDMRATEQDLLTARVTREGARTQVAAVAGLRSVDDEILSTGRSCFGFLTRDRQQALSAVVEGSTRLSAAGAPRAWRVLWGAELARDATRPRGFATDDTCDGVITARELASSTRVTWERAAAFTGLAADLGRGFAAEASIRHDTSRVARRGGELSGAGAWSEVADAASFGEASASVAVGQRRSLRGVSLSWRAAWAESHLAPSAVQLFAYPGFSANPRLAAQRGAGPAVSLGLEAPRVSLRVAAFRTRVRDEIAWDPGSRSNVNAGTTRRQGVEARLLLRPRTDVSLTLAHAVVDATLRGGFPADAGYAKGARLPLVPRSSSLVAIGLGPWRGVSADISARRTGTVPLDGDFDGSLPALRARTTLSAAVRLSLRTPDSLTLEFLAENLLDDRTPSRAIESWGETYFTPPRPRSLAVGLSWRFPSET